MVEIKGHHEQPDGTDCRETSKQLAAAGTAFPKAHTTPSAGSGANHALARSAAPLVEVAVMEGALPLCKAPSTAVQLF
jgi:hypothetical protein